MAWYEMPLHIPRAKQAGLVLLGHGVRRWDTHRMTEHAGSMYESRHTV